MKKIPEMQVQLKIEKIEETDEYTDEYKTIIQTIEKSQKDIKEIDTKIDSYKKNLNIFYKEFYIQFKKNLKKI